MTRAWVSLWLQLVPANKAAQQTNYGPAQLQYALPCWFFFPCVNRRLPQIPVEEVPSVQKFAVSRARQLGKPAIVAHQLLHSMIEYPIPTRAEVADVADVVRQRADALMLSGGCYLVIFCQFHV
jgi:hypothetical protein